jgi:hypothetical protein
MTIEPSDRARLIELVDEIRAAREMGERGSEFVARFEAMLPDTDIENLCDSDYPDETVVDVCLGSKNAQRELGRDELVELVHKIRQPTETEAESILQVIAFKHNCMHPAKTDLIFSPEDHFDGRSDPSADEIVDKAMRGS